MRDPLANDLSKDISPSTGGAPSLFDGVHSPYSFLTRTRYSHEQTSQLWYKSHTVLFETFWRYKDQLLKAEVPHCPKQFEQLPPLLRNSGCSLASTSSPLPPLAFTWLAQARPTCSRTYTVVPNDTCDAISAAQNVSTYQLAVNNPAVDAACDNLWVGQVLCLGIEGQDCSTVHVVAEGDNCEAVAQAAGTTFVILEANNPNVDAGCTNIYPGEVLCTANVTVYTN
ncbi:putative lysin motif containing protein [Lyophyllum shimeji]|uniref:Lysin motif containing protein n=1 Tax=Lyophyllum shimeji TaxID=47721 RepID=A0A9P3PSR9_LYOSH|nr:putative lysin motif containing protein [Lyophyllum shimeji]